MADNEISTYMFSPSTPVVLYIGSNAAQKRLMNSQISCQVCFVNKSICKEDKLMMSPFYAFEAIINIFMHPTDQYERLKIHQNIIKSWKITSVMCYRSKATSCYCRFMRSTPGTRRSGATSWGSDTYPPTWKTCTRRIKSHFTTIMIK